MMDSMMGWMGLAWLAGLIVVVLLVAAIVVAVRYLVKTDSSAWSVVLTVLAVIGGIALVGALAMLPMHSGMMSGFLARWGQ